MPDTTGTKNAFVAEILGDPATRSEAARARSAVLRHLADGYRLHAVLDHVEQRDAELGRWDAERMPAGTFEFDHGWLGSARKRVVESLVRHGLVELKAGYGMVAVPTPEGVEVGRRLLEMEAAARTDEDGIPSAPLR